MLIFFAVTGSWQLFNWHESEKRQDLHRPAGAGRALLRPQRCAHPRHAGTATDAASLFHARDRRGLGGDGRDRNRDGVPIQSATDYRDRLFARGNRVAGIAALDLQVDANFCSRFAMRSAIAA